MIIALSLPLLVVFALLISALLMWLTVRRVNAVLSAGVLLAICVAVAVVQGITRQSPGSTLLAIRMWAVFVLLPACAVLAVSRLGPVASTPGLLLLVGPVTFIVALVVAVTVHNILFASGR